MESEVTVTHFINPHLFWFKTIDADDPERVHVLNILEQKLGQLYKNKPSGDNQLRPQIGDQVAVNYIALNKYIRGEVLQKAEFQQEEFIVWAIDYGFPLLTKKEYLRHLPTNLRQDIGIIRVGGLANIYPAEQEYDDEEGNLVLVKKDNWLQRTCNTLEKLLTDATSINFVLQFQSNSNHNWGDLIVVNHRGNKINACDFLLKTTTAIKAEDELLFQEKCNKLNTTKIAPWLSNDRNTKMKFNTIKHNYAEHSQQKAVTKIGEDAKRKVEDWQKRNEMGAIDEFTEIPESSCVEADNIAHVDDVKFDDSVSVVLERNYIGKAGAITKNKRQLKVTNKDLSPSVLQKAFQMDDISALERSVNNFPQLSESSLSVSTNISNRMQKLALLRSSSARLKDKKKLAVGAESSAPQSDVYVPNESSSISSSSIRYQKLMEMRRKTANTENQNKKIQENTTEAQKSTTNAALKDLQSLNEKENLCRTESTFKTLDSFSYHLLEQSTTLSSTNPSNTQLSQENKSGISIENIGTKHLAAIRRESETSVFTSRNSETESCVKEVKPVLQKFNVKENDVLENKDFEFKPKAFSKIKEDISLLEDSSSVQKKAINEKPKIDQLGYDGLTLVPAGYDITRLYSYKDEKNHWHRKKTTRFESVAHDSTTSSDDFQFSNKNDQSFSSSEFIQTPQRTKLTHATTNHSNQNFLFKSKNTDDLQCSKEHAGSQISANHENIGKNIISSNISATKNSTNLNKKISQRRKLKSPTSQLSKIDYIIQQHNIEKELGNNNILDLKQLNTSSSSQKQLLDVSSSSSVLAGEKQYKIGNADNLDNSCSSSMSLLAADKTQSEKHLKNFCNLVDVKNTNHIPIVEGERKMQTKFIDHLVLAHSCIQLTPIENTADAPFLPEIHEEMRQMRVNKVYRTQVYSWSHALRNNSLFVVNSSRTGKRWSYLPPLCSLICCRKPLTTSSFGPMAIILVASLQHVELISNYCRRLMSGFNADAPSCIPSYGRRNFIETKIQLLNGCGILVATATSLLRLFKDNDNEPLFNSERLQHIVIDNLDIVMSRAHKDFENALQTLFKLAKKNKNKKLTPQLIVTSRDWDNLLVKLIRKSSQPLLLIGDFLEAAVYGRTKISIKLKPSEEKYEAVAKFIKKMTKSSVFLNNRTLIICNDNEDVEKLLTYLRQCGYPCLGYYSRSTEIERIAVEEWKKKVSSQIIVCTDVSFCELQIQNVNNLIHYSLPASWTRFTRRFSALARTYKNYVSNNFEEIVVSTTSNEHNAHAVILLDESNNMQLPRLVEFMHKHNQLVHEKILAVSKRVMVEIEEQKIVNRCNICPQLLEFGECDETRCDNRHVLTRFDAINKSDDIPCIGEIRIHILKVFSPTHYAVRLLRHKLPNSSNWLEVRRSSEALAFALQLDMHYRNESNLSLHWPPCINDMCIYQYADNFRRARILDAPVFQQNNTNVIQSYLKVSLKLIDDGAIINSVKCSEIYVCDDKFKNFPAQAIDVRLMNIVPFDNERTWDSRTTKQVQKWLIEDIKSDHVIQASIDFSLADTIWVKNVVVMQKLNGINAYYQMVHLKKSLVEKNFGVIYKGGRKHIRDLADEYGLLNAVQENKIENEDTDLDLSYQSCQNESINLMKFSSSNDSSMASAEHDFNVGQSINQRSSEKKSHFAEILNNTEDKEVNAPLFEAGANITQIKQITSPPKTESWSQLPLNEIVKIEIGDEGENGNWENIFVQIIDNNFMFLFVELEKLIKKHIDSIKANNLVQVEIYDFEPLHNCLVKYDNKYLRAKVYGIYGEIKEQRLYRFFLCDYACFINAKYDDLYKDFLYSTTEEIITFTPYQAVHCSLAGIKWDSFTKRYQVTKDYLYACAVLEIPPNEKSSINLPINSYKILLYECENENEFSSALLFNKTLLDNGITVCDENTKTFLDYEICIDGEKSKQHKKEEEVSSKTEVFTCEKLIQSIQSGAFDIDLSGIMNQMQDNKEKTSETIENSGEDTNSHRNIIVKNSNTSEKKDDSKDKVVAKGSKIPKSDSDLDEQGDCYSNTNSNKSSVSLSSTDISNCSIDLPPPLKALSKRPLTTWYENDCMIFLSIYAPDVKEYFLEVTSKTVLFVASIQGEKSVLHMNLLGFIQPKHVSHEIKGLNVVIRLIKLVYERWPRLLQEPTKYSWLKYNLNGFDWNEMQQVNPQQCLHTIMDSGLYTSGERDGLNSDNDSERDLYQTYNPILDNEDDWDPFSV